MSVVTRLIDRLEKVNWATTSESEDVDVVGVTTYLDVVADLMRSEAIGIDVLFSPLRLFGEQARLSPGLNDRLESVISVSENAYEKLICRNATEWAALCEAGDRITAGRETLFEPLVALIEKRVPVRLAKGYFWVDGNAFPLQRWPDGYGVNARAST